MKTKILLLIILIIGFGAINLFAQVPSYVPTNGLEGWWSFTGNAIDSSGNMNNGTVNGATLVNDRFSNANSAYSFNGGTNVITVADSPTLQFGTNMQSISFWIKVPSIPTPNVGPVIEKYDQHLSINSNGDAGKGYAVQFGGDGSLHYSFMNGNNIWGDCAISSAYCIPNQYYFVVFTNDNDSCKGYINGVEVSSSKLLAGAVIGSNTLPLLFGNTVQAGGTPFQGSLDDIGFWNRALTPCEISELYNTSLFTGVAITGTTTICSGTNTTLTASGGTSYLWNTTATTSTISVSPTTFTTYTVTGTNAYGCTNTATVSVTVNPLPTITVNSPTICSGTSTAITSSGALTYSWNTGSTTNPITVNPTTTTNYTVTGTDGNGCKNSSIATVTVNPLPTVTISGLSAICAGIMDTLVANASGSSPFTYNWSTSSTNDSIEVSTANTYSVTIADANGCSNTAIASVIVNPLPTITITGIDSIISGTNDTLTASGGTSYVWTSGSTTDTTVVAPTATTTYSVTASNSFGCSAVDSFTVVIKITTGIANLTENNNTNLYPNPNNGIFTINFENKFAKNDRIEIYNVLGKMVNSTILNSTSTQINMKDDAAGIYMYKVLSENGSMISTGKIIVQ